MHPTRMTSHTQDDLVIPCDTKAVFFRTVTWQRGSEESGVPAVVVFIRIGKGTILGGY